MQSKVTPNIQAEERSKKGTRAAVKKLSREYRDMKNYIAYINEFNVSYKLKNRNTFFNVIWKLLYINTTFSIN